MWAEREAGGWPHCGDDRYRPEDDPESATFIVLQVERALAGRPDLRSAARTIYLSERLIPGRTARWRRDRLLQRIVWQVGTGRRYDATIVEAAILEARRARGRRGVRGVSATDFEDFAGSNDEEIA